MRIAVIGDVHLCWDDRDVALLDAAGYDLVLFVGDLAGYGPSGGLMVARSIARMRTPALVLPGNHDAVTTPQLAAEVFAAPAVTRELLAFGMGRRVESLRRALAPIPLAGYSLHRFQQLWVLGARPHSVGGPRLAFRRYLARHFGVRTLQDSAAKLCSLLDTVAAGEPIVVLAHCGPSGLGAERTDIYGCDFRPEAGDWGDPDLAEALAHARRTGKRVLAVLAGHMHHAVRGGGKRSWQLQVDGVQHINAARVPRSKPRKPDAPRHHVCLKLGSGLLEQKEVWLS